MDTTTGWTSRPRAVAPLREASSSFSDRHGLTTRERDVVLLLAGGVAQVADLAAALKLRPNTVHNHLKGIFRRTRTRSKSELLAALLMHALERTDLSARLYRRPQILLLDECRLFADALTSLGMRVHEGEGEALQVGDEVRIDAVVTPWRGPRHELALRERLGPATRLLLTSASGHGSELAPSDGAPLPFDASRVAFEILVSLCDDPYTRSRLLRIDGDFPALVDSRIEARVANLGFGGAFVTLPTHLLEGPSALRAGEVVEVALTVTPDHVVRTRAAVVWTRPASRVSQPAGMGVRFVDLAAEDQSRLEELVRSERIRAMRASVASARPLHAQA